MPVIDWSASSPHGHAGAGDLFAAASGDSWIVDFLAADAKKKDLATATGLSVALRSKGAKA